MQFDSVPYNRDGMYLSDPHNCNYIYNNDFGSCDKGIFLLSSEEDSIYIQKNHFATNGDAIYINYAYVEICDNYFEGCDLSGPSEYELIGIIKIILLLMLIWLFQVDSKKSIIIFL